MNPLEQLKDIHLPAQVGMWPPAWGWWLVALITISIMILTLRWLIKRYRKKQAIREAIALFSQLDSQAKDYLQQLNSLLKRLCLSYFPRRNIASLHQQAWCEFLTSQLPTKKQAEFSSNYQLLLNGLYDPTASTLEHQQAGLLVKNWIKTALPPKKRELKHV